MTERVVRGTATGHRADGAKGYTSVDVLLAGAVPCGQEGTFLPHDGDKVGGFEKWMVNFLENEAKEVADLGYPYLGRRHKTIATAISDLFQGGGG